MITLLDGPIGTQLHARGVPTPAPAWSAWALKHQPEAVGVLHREYAEAGATVHTTATFRTRPEALGSEWLNLAQRAVALARGSVPGDHRIAGCIAPLADCYRPDLSPLNPGPAHAALAQVLVDAGVDLLLCETFPHVEEALAAVAASVQTGVETWVSFTAGPGGDLMTPDQMTEGAARARDLGVSAVLVNCISLDKTPRFLDAIAQTGLPFGAYANAGHPDDGVGWVNDGDGPERYVDQVASWIEQGATLIGSCCGTSPAHIAALQRRFGATSSS